MAFYSILSKEKCVSGIYDFHKAYPLELRPYQKMILYPFQYVSPVAITYITVDSTDKHSFRYFLYTAGSILYFSFSKEELNQIIFDYISPYQHENYDFVYILDGECSYTIDGKKKTFRKDDCYLQSPYIVKCEDYSTDYSTLTLLISPTLLQEVGIDTTNYRDYTFFYLLNKFRKDFYQPTIRSLLCDLIDLFFHPTMPGFPYLLKGYLGKLFYILNSSELYHKSPMTKENRSYLFEQITALIKESDGRVSRTELAKKLHYSGDYINTLVKKYTKMTLTEFQNMYALQKASWLLLNSEMKIEEICIKLRYTDQTYFYKIFKKKYGMTPKKYRDLFHL